MEENHDFISNLPDEILQLIISMISFKEAVQCSTISTSWRSRLMSPIRVDIDQDSILSNSHEAKQSSLIMQSFVESDDRCCFKSLKLYLDSYSDGPFSTGARGAHGELHLDFLVLPCNKFSMILEQRSFFTCTRFSCIKLLQLRSVSNLVGDLVSDLFSSFRVLESLKLEKCNGLENLEIRSNGCLKSLEIADCPNIDFIVLSVQNLESFAYFGALPIIQLVETPNLVDFTLDLSEGLGSRNTFDCEEALILLSSVKDVEILRISSWLLEALCSGGVIFSSLGFQFSKLKKLWCICSTISSKTRDSLACFLNITPSLEGLSLQIDQTCKTVECPLSNMYWHEPHLWNDYETVKSNGYRLKDLKSIKIIGFGGEKDELLLMDLLLHNAINLKEMIVHESQQSDDYWRVIRIPFSQIRYIKVKYMLIYCPDNDLHFVLRSQNLK